VTQGLVAPGPSGVEGPKGERMAWKDEPHKGKRGAKPRRSNVGFGEKSHNPAPDGKRAPAEGGDDTQAANCCAFRGFLQYTNRP
jgi:hypothetical protein